MEDIADLYRQSGRLREAVVEAENALKANPNDLNARRVLARIYTQQIGDSQANRIDEGMLKRAIEQYKLITSQDPKDIESLIMLGRLEKLMQDSVQAENAFQKALTLDPDNEDALSGLAMVYADLGDANRASNLLEKLSKKSPSPRAFALLASSYEQMHEYRLAADAYKQALQLDPGPGRDQAGAGAGSGAFGAIRRCIEAVQRDSPDKSTGFAGISAYVADLPTIRGNSIWRARRMTRRSRSILTVSRSATTRWLFLRLKGKCRKPLQP